MITWCQNNIPGFLNIYTSIERLKLMKVEKLLVWIYWLLPTRSWHISLIWSSLSACILKWFFTCYLQQLRHICKTYGVRASISTANARDSIYRVSINFVLDYCERYVRHNFLVIVLVFFLSFLKSRLAI